MLPRHPRSTRTDPRFPYTTLCRALRLDLGEPPPLLLEPEASQLDEPLESTDPHPASPAVAASRPRIAASMRRSEEHTSELQSLMRISYAVFCLKKKKETIYSHFLV